MHRSLVRRRQPAADQVDDTVGAAEEQVALQLDNLDAVAMIGEVLDVGGRAVDVAAPFHARRVKADDGQTGIFENEDGTRDEKADRQPLHETDKADDQNDHEDDQPFGERQSVAGLDEPFLHEPDAEEEHKAAGQKDRDLKDQRSGGEEPDQHHRRRRNAGAAAGGAGLLGEDRHRKSDKARGPADTARKHICKAT